MTIPHIEITKLYKAFGSKKVLDGIDLTINKGESLVIVGGSGSGKSVLIKTINGLIPIDSGTIKINGQDASHLSEAERNTNMAKMGFLFQGGALFDSLTVWHNISFGLMKKNKLSSKEARDIAIELLKDVGLDSKVADLFPAELSGGMQKRVALVRAIAINPEIIFLDEPTTGLDPILANVINELIIHGTRKLGATTVTISHDMDSIRKIANRVAMLYKGKIIWTGSVLEMDNSDNPYVQQFVTGSTKGPIQI
jgi:phospholipid/cholesterol/gamma-HCH transport system ATP-binding protein